LRSVRFLSYIFDIQCSVDSNVDDFTFYRAMQLDCHVIAFDCDIVKLHIIKPDKWTTDIF